MSSIHEALQMDINRGRSQKANQLVLRSRQEAEDGPIGADFFARKELEHWQERARRRAEGGRGGGFFDRQVVVERKGSNEEEADEIDDFGRKRSRQVADGLSKAARAQAALQRLRKANRSDGSGGGEGSPSGPARPVERRRSRSRSAGGQLSAPR
mmetsp:Transcript_61094/g.176040  ORF Transcript_61094/g.176040 Transcript_61094/m.176040 type:complete len:155 (-) Transcript_61094:46-510(-)